MVANKTAKTATGNVPQRRRQGSTPAHTAMKVEAHMMAIAMKTRTGPVLSGQTRQIAAEQRQNLPPLHSCITLPSASYQGWVA